MLYLLAEEMAELRRSTCTIYHTYENEAFLAKAHQHQYVLLLQTCRAVKNAVVIYFVSSIPAVGIHLSYECRVPVGRCKALNPAAAVSNEDVTHPLPEVQGRTRGPPQETGRCPQGPAIPSLFFCYQTSSLVVAVVVAVTVVAVAVVAVRLPAVSVQSQGPGCRTGSSSEENNPPAFSVAFHQRSQPCPVFSCLDDGYHRQ